MVCKSSDKQLGQPTAKEKALNYGRMVATTQANSNKMLSKVLACIFGLTDLGTQEIGYKMKCTDMESLNGLMEGVSKDNSNKA